MAGEPFEDVFVDKIYQNNSKYVFWAFFLKLSGHVATVCFTVGVWQQIWIFTLTSEVASDRCSWLLPIFTSVEVQTIDTSIALFHRRFANVH